MINMLCMQVKDGNRKSGTGRIMCPFFDEIDAIIGTRAASEPTVLLESGGADDDVEGGDEDGLERSDPSNDPGFLSIMYSQHGNILGNYCNTCICMHVVNAGTLSGVYYASAYNGASNAWVLFTSIYSNKCFFCIINRSL